MNSFTVTPIIRSSALNYVSESETRIRHNRNYYHKDKASNTRFVCDKCKQVYSVIPEKEVQVDYFGADHIPTYGLRHQDCPKCCGVKLDYMNFVDRKDADKWLDR